MKRARQLSLKDRRQQGENIKVEAKDAGTDDGIQQSEHDDREIIYIVC